MPKEILKDDSPAGGSKEDRKRPSFFLRDFFNCFIKNRNGFADRWKAALHAVVSLLIADTNVTVSVSDIGLFSTSLAFSSFLTAFA